jgi:hypothetical protein
MTVGFGFGTKSSRGALVGTGGSICGWQLQGSSHVQAAGRLVHT